MAMKVTICCQSAASGSKAPMATRTVSAIAAIAHIREVDNPVTLRPFFGELPANAL